MAKVGKKPKPIINPVLMPQNRIYYDIFCGVRGCRRLDKMQPIPVIDIINLCVYYKMSETNIEETVYIIKSLDCIAMEKESKRQKEALENVNR